LEIYCRTRHKLPEVAEEILGYGKDLNIWVLKGDLGAGKTTFIQELARHMNVIDHTSSPSYALINEYITATGEKIYHFDLFRIKTISEALDIGMEEYLDSGSYCFIEWPEVAEPLLPDRYLEVNIENPENELRVFKIQRHE